MTLGELKLMEDFREGWKGGERDGMRRTCWSVRSRQSRPCGSSFGAGLSLLLCQSDLLFLLVLNFSSFFFPSDN